MVPLEIEVGYSEESEINIGDPTQSLLRVHTDECVCTTTMELGNNTFIYLFKYLFIYFYLLSLLSRNWANFVDADILL